MEESKAYTSATELPSLPPLQRPRHEPDVPEDVDFLMDHLNDPNYDLTKGPPSIRTARSMSFKFADEKGEIPGYPGHSEGDSDSYMGTDRYASSRAESRNSTAIEFDDESPYPEVRAAVSSVDDPTMPVNTFRMWFLGLFFTVLISGLNQFFSLRYPSVLITGIVAQLGSLPMGKGLEKILPRKKFRTFGYSWSLNPGPFNIKEHVLVTVMANVVVGGAYATDIVLTQRVFYHQTYTFSYQMMLILSSQIVGFSLGGILRRFVVWPAPMIWPGALVNCALFHTLHKNYGLKERRHLSREKFFLIVVGCSFVWYWVPGYLFTALSVFNWVCWIAPNNVPVNALFGANSGLGMGIFTFDWSMISFIGSPLVTPWWAEANTVAALVFWFWLIVPIMYFTNRFFFAYLPISAYTTFDNTGLPYDPTRLLTNGLFDLEKYRAYSPLYLSSTMAMAYGLAFAAFASVITHTFLWFRHDIMRRFRSSLKDERDVHSRLMQAYPEVPQWWYLSIGVISFTLLLISIHLFPTEMPIWGVCVAFLIACILSIPLAMIQAITNQQIALNVVHEMVGGYLIPGRPVANMIFKAVAYIGTNQAIGFAGDLKLGHYMKVPPRVMFAAQVVAAFVSCFVVTLVQDWMFANIPDFCHRGQKNGFSCPSTNTFASASLIWGGIGPRRLFSPGGLYSPLMAFFGIGALLPVPLYFLARRFPLSFWRYINVPVFFAGIGAMPPASGINYASWALTGFTFNYCVRRWRFRWWMRYNYILSAGLDAGVGLGIIVVFFTVGFPKGGFSINWWGNTVWQNTADAMGVPLKALAPNATFGLTSWS